MALSFVTPLAADAAELILGNLKVYRQGGGAARA